MVVRREAGRKPATNEPVRRYAAKIDVSRVGGCRLTVDGVGRSSPGDRRLIRAEERGDLRGRSQLRELGGKELSRAAMGFTIDVVYAAAWRAEVAVDPQVEIGRAHVCTPVTL